MATLKIVSLECVKKQDTWNKDEIAVWIDGAKVSGPHTMAKNDIVTLNTTRTFTVDADITLMEEDPGTDDNLGTVRVTEAQSGLGTLTGNFHRLQGADYHMRYTVTA